MNATEILRQIKSLQNSRDYADEVESVRLTAAIKRLLILLEQTK